MPTPTSVFHRVAAKYGNIDPSDSEAVQRWFTEELPSLSPALIETILEELLTYDGTRPVEQIARIYPKGAPIPSLASSPPVRSPLLAAGWRELVRRLYGRVKGSSPDR